MSNCFNGYLLGSDVADLVKLANELGEPSYRGRQLYHWLYVKRTQDFESMSSLSGSFRKRLAECSVVTPIDITAEEKGSDNSRKFVFALPDGHRVEGVLIPDGDRLTACLSSQIGCVVGCGFCATGRMGFIRNLSAGEIVGQFVALQSEAELRITNVVMMGMGEPLLNRSNLFKAARLITDPNGLAVSHWKFNVSTVGWLPGIRALIKSGLRLKFSISLNGTTDEQRGLLMPLTARFSLDKLLGAARDYALSARQRITFTYLLLNGVNDSLEDALRLADLIKSIPCKVNLLEYNEVCEGFFASGHRQVETFREALIAAGLNATVRTSRGKDITAACGQLAGGYKPGDGRLIPKKCKNQEVQCH